MPKKDLIKKKSIEEELKITNNFKKISEKLKVSEWLVSKVAKDIGIYSKMQKTKNEYPQIEKLFQEGFSITEIGRRLNIDYETISKIIKNKGYTFSSCNKKDINSKIFNNIDTEEKAYWLGFLYADGCVSDDNTIELNLAVKDIQHLEKYKEFLKYKGSIKYKLDTKSSRIVFQDHEIGNNLKRLGCVPRKSLILTFPTEEQVPKHLIHHFIRGYFDGDGHISDPTKKSIVCEFLGTEFFIKEMCNKLNISFLNRLKKDKRMNDVITRVGFYGQNALDLLDILYKDSVIFLNRKYERFLNFKYGNKTRTSRTVL